MLNKINTGVSKARKEHEKVKLAARLKELRTQIEAAWAKYQWDEAERLLAECVALDPKDQDARDALEKLRKGLASKNPEHQAAQQTVRHATNITSIDDLLGRWDELNQALLTLVDNEDGFLLIQTEANIDKWVQLIGRETQRVQALSAGNQSLTQQEAAELQTRIDALKKIAAELPQTSNKIDAILTPDTPSQ